MITMVYESGQSSADKSQWAHDVNHMMTGNAQGELNSRKPRWHEVERGDKKERGRK
jgi:hypothetical protein